MRRVLTLVTVALLVVPAFAQDGATAKCRDGTYSHSKHRSGTCSHHGGVASWINKPKS